MWSKYLALLKHIQWWGISFHSFISRCYSSLGFFCLISCDRKKLILCFLFLSPVWGYLFFFFHFHLNLDVELFLNSLQAEVQLFVLEQLILSHYKQDSFCSKMYNKSFHSLKERLEMFSAAFMLSCSAVSDSVQPHELLPPRLLHPWNSPGKNTGVGYDFLLQGVFCYLYINQKKHFWN